MLNKTLFLPLIFIVFTSIEAFAQTHWEVDKSQDDIVVYLRATENSDFKSFKAETEVEASIAEVLRLIQNADNYTKWFGYTNSSHVLKKEKNVQYNYVETIFPWPYRNRDMVYRMSIDTLSFGNVEISLKGIPDFIPEKKRIIRMKKAEGYMLLETLGNKTKITYFFHSEPEGKIPSRLANNSISELPFRTLRGLKLILKENIRVND